MNIIGLDGKNYSWIPTNAQCNGTKSKLHIRAKKLLTEMYPNDRILEEISLPGTKNSFRKTVLRADLFLPMRKLLIEVHGEQHHKFNSFFFRNKLEFYKAKARDNDKKAWCDLNDITLIELNYNEDIDEWRRKVQ